MGERTEVGGPGSGPPLPWDRLWQFIEEIPDTGTVSNALAANDLSWHTLGKARRADPDFAVRYREACAALADQLAHRARETLSPSILEQFSEKRASAVASLQREQAAHDRWLAARLDPAAFGDRVTHTHDVGVRAVIALPELGTLAPAALPAGAPTIRLPAGVPGGGVAEADVVSVEGPTTTRGVGNGTGRAGAGLGAR